MNRFTKWFVFLKIYSFPSHIHVYFQLVAFIREPIWHKALWMGYWRRLELTCAWSLNGFQLVMGTHTHTHTHTQLPRVKQQKHIKYQRPIRGEQTKVDTLRKNKRKEWPLYKPITNRKPFKLQTQVSSSLNEYPICKVLCHIGSLMKATSWKHTHM